MEPRRQNKVEASPAIFSQYSRACNTSYLLWQDGVLSGAFAFGRPSRKQKYRQTRDTVGGGGMGGTQLEQDDPIDANKVEMTRTPGFNVISM